MNGMSGLHDSFDDDPELRQRIREAGITRPRLSAFKPPQVNGHAAEDLPPVDFGVNGGAYEPDVPPADWLPEQAKAAEEISEPKKTLQALTAQLLQSSAQFIEGFIPPDYVLDGILQRRFIYSLTGRTGSGKTAIVLLIAASVALGRSIGAHEVQKGRVLYFAGENPDDIRMRWIAMAQHMDFDDKEIEVCFIPGTFKISELAAQVALEAKTAGPFVLVIIDTSAAYFEGEDENSNTQAGAHARRLRGLVSLPGNPCVIVNCHPPKNAGDDNVQPRGGGAYIAEMDGNLTARKDDGVVELHWQGKFRGPDFPPISFQLKTVTHERLKDTKSRNIPTVIATHLSEAAKDEIAKTARSDENRVLGALVADPSASYTQIARNLGLALKSGDPNKMAVSRIVKKLKDAKLVTIERDKPVITEKGKKALKGDVTASAKNAAKIDA